MNALLFPGQGSQEVGMGKELYETLPEARAIVERACDILDYDLKELMFEGPVETLTDTRYAQPAIYTCSAMHLEKARLLGIQYDYVAGHSLGEYSALYAAGIVSFEDGLVMVDKRGKAMSAQNGKGCMAAVLGISEEELSDYMIPDVVMANLNTKTQIVISGTVKAVDTVIERLSKNKILAKKLLVSAAFHSPQMSEASIIMDEVIENTHFNSPLCSLVSNVTGTASADEEIIRKNLREQITGQVRWCDSILFLKEKGVQMLFEIGHGKILTKMNKGITMSPKCVSV